MSIRATTILLIVAALVVGIFLYNKYRVAPEISVQSLELTRLDGSAVDKELLAGKKLFINFFASWCGPCAGEMNALREAQDSLMADGYLFVCISDESPDKIMKFKERTNSPLLFLKSTTELKQIGIVTWPTSYVVDTRGHIKYKKVGIEDWNSAGVLNQLRAIHDSR